MRQMVAGLVGVVASVIALGQPSAETLTVGPFEAPAELETTAESLRLLLENERGPATGILSSRVGLSPEDSDFFLTGSLSLDGHYVIAKATLHPRGTSAGAPFAIERKALRGQVAELADLVGAAIDEHTGLSLGKRASLPIAEAVPFAKARHLFDRGELEQAALALSGGNRQAMRSVPGAERIAREILESSKVPVSERLGVASALDLYDEADGLIAQLPDGERDKWKRLFSARRQLVRYDVKSALPDLQRLSKSGSVEAHIGLAKVAKMKQDEGLRLQALERLVATNDPAAAEYISTLTPEEIPAELGPEVVKLAARVRENNPSLSAQLTFLGATEQLESVDVYYLAPEQAAQVATSLAAKPEPTTDEALLLVDLNISAGNVDEANRLAAIAAERAPEDPRAQAQQRTLEVMTSVVKVQDDRMDRIDQVVAEGKPQAPAAPTKRVAATEPKETKKAKVESDFEEESAVPWEIVLAVVGALVLLVAVKRFGSTGAVVVKVKIDKTTKDYLSLTLSKAPKPPKIGQPKAWVEKLKSSGTVVKGKTVQFVSGEHRFGRVSPGTRYVHVFGVIVEEGTLYPTFRTQQVIVEKNKTHTVAFDLVRKEAEFRVNVSGEGGLIKGAKVWVEGFKERAVMSDSDGVAVVSAPPGEYEIYVSYNGEEISQGVRATHPTRHTIDLNIERQKRLNALADGIDVDLGGAGAEDVAEEYRAASTASSAEDTDGDSDNFRVSIGDDLAVDDSGAIPLLDDKGGF